MTSKSLKIWKCLLSAGSMVLIGAVAMATINTDPPQKGRASLNSQESVLSRIEATGTYTQNSGANPLVAQASITPLTFSPGQALKLIVGFSMPPGYRAYVDQFLLDAEYPTGFAIANVSIAPQEKFNDPFTKKMKMVVYEKGELQATLEAPSNLPEGPLEIRFRMSYQACTKDFCLFPKDKIFAVQAIVYTSQKLDELPKKTLWSSISGGEIGSLLTGGNLWLAFLFAFLAGIFTSFTPCIFPMIPITLAVLGQGAHGRRRSHQLRDSALYVIGIGLTYSILGVFAASTGALFGSYLNHPILLGVFCTIFLLMALSLFGLFEVQAPLALQNQLARVRLRGWSGALLSGAISGVVASPCVGPVLVGILTYVAKSQNVYLGFGLLFVYALGLGQLLILVAMSSLVTKLLPKSGSWMQSVKHFFGILMLGVFYYYLSLLVSRQAWEILIGIGMVIYSVFGGALRKATPHMKNRLRFQRGFMQAVLLAGVFVAVSSLLKNESWLKKSTELATSSGVHWHDFSMDLVTKAQGKGVMVDFYADWCLACHELDKNTFSDPRVREKLKELIVTRYDSTKPSEELSNLSDKFGIVGLPTVLFLDPEGRLLSELTLTQFEGPELFLARLGRLKLLSNSK